MKYDKYLPIGTVVLLNGAQKKIMITGFCVKGDDQSKTFDYCGCMYPEGVLASDKNLLFNHEQIESVYYMGYMTDEEKTFKTKLNDLIKTLQSETNNN